MLPNLIFESGNLSAIVAISNWGRAKGKESAKRKRNSPSRSFESRRSDFFALSLLSPADASIRYSEYILYYADDGRSDPAAFHFCAR